MRYTLLPIIGLVLGFVLISLPCDARTMRLEDYLDMEQVAAPQISPDGKVIVYTRSWVNVAEDRFDSELWVMDSVGGRNRRLVEGGTDVHWSRDGSRITYLGNTDRGPEIFVRWMDGDANTSQVTHQGMKPENLSWSPDGRWIAFMAKVPEHSGWEILLPQKPEGAHWTEDALVVDKLHYRLDGAGYTTGQYSHVFIVSAEGGRPKQLTYGAWNAEPRKASMAEGGSLEWTPDSRSILFSADQELDADIKLGRASLYAVDISDGHVRTITRTTGYWGLWTGPRVSPDGKRIAYFGTQASNTSNYPSLELHVIGIDGAGDRTLIDDLPGRVSYLQWADNGKALYYAVGKEGATNVYSVTLSGKVEAITTGAQTIALSSVSRAGIAVGTLTSAYKPPDVVRFDLKDGRNMHTLTAVNDDVLGEVQLGRVEEIWYESSDNTRVQGWIVYPPDFNPGKKYPLILDIHGGPENMYEGNFKFAFQDMAAQGYVVLYTNPRGSSGYGGAFSRAIYNAYPGPFDYADLMHGVDAVVSRGFVDDERLYVQGCSGGGTLTAWVITQTDRFAAAAARCPITNMLSFASTTDIVGWAFNRFKKPFWEDPSAWLASSSIMQINKVKTPTLVMVGERDIRTPVAQSEELFSGLKLMNVPTKLILFKDEWHGTSSKPSNMLRTQLYLRKWYGEWRRKAQNGTAVSNNVE